MGIHTHNNMAKAIDNSFTALAEGVEWLDVTVTGMGRGAGNAQTENLLALLAKQGNTHYQPDAVYELVVRYFEAMQRECGWGSSLLYFLGAQNDIHPTYIQNLLSNSHYGTEEVVGAIGYLSSLEGTSSYSGEVLEAALNINSQAKPVAGSDKLKGLFAGREVLIVNNGPSLGKYLRDIETYIRERQPVVIAVNVISELAEDFVDYFCVSHNTKYLSESTTYQQLVKPLILPAHRFESAELGDLKVPFVDYGLQVTSDEFAVKGNFCVVPYDLTFAYAVAAAVEGNAALITLVGSDGYKSTDTRQLEMLKLISTLRRSDEAVELKSLTPSSYPVAKGSIYAPVI
jgi:4-hydroxy 2-oxovalerate aldolase